MEEIVSKRTYTAKTYQTGSNQFVMEAHRGHIFYKENGIFTPVDYTLIDEGTYWKVTKASYNIYIKKDFSANTLILYQNKFEGANHSITYDPKLLAWVNKTDLSDYQVFRTAQAVTGSANGNVITYKDAFGPNIDFEITVTEIGFKKEIVIQQKSALELPPTAQHKLVAMFKYAGEGINIKNLSGNSWNQSDYFESEDGFVLERSATERSYVLPAYISDSSEIKNSKLIKVFWKLHNGNLWQAKVLPTLFLQNATYPVRADTDTNVTVGTGYGDIATSGSSFTTIQTAATGTVEALLYPQCSKWTTTYYIKRVFMPFDTSGIGAGATISAATLYFTVQDTPGNANSVNLVVVQSNQANATSLAAGDYDGMGTTSGGSIAYPATGACSIALNATGIGWINPASYTKLGLRLSNDISASEPTGLNQLEINTTQANTYLTITYTTGSPPTSIKDIIGMGIIPFAR